MTKKALVIGAAGGVGAEVVKRLVSGAYDVFGTVMNEPQRTELLQRSPALAAVVVLDLADADAVAATLEPVLAAAGRLDAAIICAAVSPYGPLETTPLSAFRRTMEINAVADLAVYQAVIPLLRASRGRLIVISSMAGKVAFPFIGHYASSKFALEALVDVMRREARQWGVEVVAIEPGGLKTPMVSEQIRTISVDNAALSDDIRALYGRQYSGFESVLKAGYETATPPSDVADIVIRSLTAAIPDPRYVVGNDAISILELSKTLSDRELDEVAKLEALPDAVQDP